MRDKIISTWKENTCKIDLRPGFKLKKFKKFHWRLFLGDNKIYFLFVCGVDEITLFVSLKKDDGFVPMYDFKNTDDLYVICRGDEDFEACQRIILQKDAWKKDTVLFHKSKRKIIKALCNASVFEPHIFKEIKCNQCSDTSKLASILSILTKKES